MESDGTDGTGGLPPAVVEDLLADERRRRVLRRLESTDGPVLVEDLAPVVFGGADEDGPPDLADDRLQAARAELFDRHLPVLTATCVVEYDPMVNAVELVDDEVATRLE